ncbi:hypothetical protein AAKU61_002518 [Undibacterium sp. GrIS 1.2]|uniref:DUF2087 domain-containing protein n=1 Tax=Undibacterium sp. GrIS 1.2 TaxID=3143933 RepID=UPI00339AF1D5
MNALTTEIKTRARLLLKLLQTNNVAATKRALLLSRQHNWTLPETWQLRHCLNLAAADAGFQHWEHARAVLFGEAQTEDVKPDFGDFWHGKEVSGYTNHWYASYAEAQLQLQVDPASYLLPYRLQFIVVKVEYLHALGVSTDAAWWQPIANDLVLGYGSASWLALSQQRLQASRIERFNVAWDARQTTLDLESTDAESQRVMQAFVQNNRLKKIPDQRKKRLVILRWLVNQLQTERRYAESEINQFFLQYHEDYATLRREMITNMLMKREDGVYWRL